MLYENKVEYKEISYINKLVNNNCENLEESLIWGICMLPFLSKISQANEYNGFFDKKIMIMESLSRLSIEYSNILFDESKSKIIPFQYFTYKKQYPFILIDKSLYKRLVNKNEDHLLQGIGVTILRCTPFSTRVEILDTIDSSIKKVSKSTLNEVLNVNCDYYDDSEYLVSFPPKKINNLNMIVKKSIKDNLRFFSDENIEGGYIKYNLLRKKESKVVLREKYDFFYKYIEFLEACNVKKLLNSKHKVKIDYKILKVIRSEINSKGNVDWKKILLLEKEFYKNIREYMG